MENNLISSEQVKNLCEIFNIDLSILKEHVPEEDWDEDFFLIDKCDFFMKSICINKRFIYKYCIYKEKIFVIDDFPMAIPIEGKFPQLEVFYRQDDKNNLNFLYFQEEKKFLNVLSKLWAYSSVYLESSILRENLSIQIIEDEQFKLLKQLFSEKSIVSTNEWKLLEYLFALSLKNCVYTCVYFIDLRMIVWLDSLCATLYICDKEQEDFVKTICTTEGLYLRR